MKKQQLWKALFLLLAGLCCGVLIFLPKMISKWSDQKLFGQEHLRPSVEGMLDEEGQSIPIVYALYQKRYLQQRYLKAAIGMEPKEDEWIMGLYENEVLPESFVQMLLPIMAENVEAERNTQVQPGFCTTTYRKPWDEVRQSQEMITIEWYENTSHVITLHAELTNLIPEEVNAQECLTHYQKYLGVEALNDWIASPSNSERIALLWSEKGQLYLYCRAIDSEFQLGARSMEKQDVQQFFSE